MKRFIINILLAIIVFPTIFLVRDYIKLDIMNDHSAYVGTFKESLKHSAPVYFGIGSTLFLILVLLPYNLIVLRFKNISFFRKILLFEAIMIVDICLISTYTNLLFYPYWKNIYYLIYLMAYAFIFGGLIHILVDKKVITLNERQ